MLEPFAPRYSLNTLFQGLKALKEAEIFTFWVNDVALFIIMIGNLISRNRLPDQDEIGSPGEELEHGDDLILQ